MDKYLKLDSNANILESNPSDVSHGSADSGKIVALNNDGKIDDSMLPDTISPEVVVVEAGENLVKGDLVYICDASGTVKCFKAKADSIDTLAQGFVIENANAGDTVKVYSEGILERDDMTFTIGSFYFLSLTEAGKPSLTFPNADPNGAIILLIGTAISSNKIQYEKSQPIVRVYKEGGSGCDSNEDPMESYTPASPPPASDDDPDVNDPNDVSTKSTSTQSTGVSPVDTSPTDQQYTSSTPVHDGGSSSTQEGDYESYDEGGTSGDNTNDTVDGGYSSSSSNEPGSNWVANTLYVEPGRGEIYPF